MSKVSLRTASIACLAIWVATWLLFLLMRLSPLDIRSIPGSDACGAIRKALPDVE
jgi:hypothetical protein